ncbi:MAG: hypothetical protein GY856_27860 [bacterium]|nr:hypothetical protein [bacterium]
MTRKALCSCLLTVFFLCMPIPPTARAAQVDDRELIDMSLENAPLVAVLQSFAKINGCELKIDPEVTGSVTVQLKRTPWTDALDQVCRIHRLSCEILAGDPPILRVRKLDSGDVRSQPCLLPGYGAAINLSLKDADLRAVLESMAKIAGRSVTIDDDVDGAVTMNVKQAPWTVVLTEICGMSGCRIKWGADEIRVVAAPEERRLHSINLTLEKADLVNVLKSFAKVPIFCNAGDIEVEIAEALTGSVSLDLKNTAWSVAIEEICERAGCVWEVSYGDPPVLRFSARQDRQDPVAAFLVHPPAGAKPPAVAARFHPPGRAVPVEGDVSFSWTQPIHILDVPGDDHWQAKLTWIPLGPELQLVLPVLIRCRGAEKTVEMLDPVKIPLTESWTGQRGGARLELRPAAVQSGRRGGSKSVEECLPAPGVAVGASFRRAGSKAADRELRTEVGAYLLVTPPVGEPDPGPTVAVVAIDHDRRDREILAVIMSSADGTSIDVGKVTIPAGGVGRGMIRIADGRKFELALRVVPSTAND